MEAIKNLTWIEIDLNAIANNYHEIKNRVKKPIIAVLKADAYGLGAKKISEILYSNGCKWFAVARLSEAISIFETIPNANILILGPLSDKEVLSAMNFSFQLTVHSVPYLQRLVSAMQRHPAANKLAIHLKIETGFGRLGLDEREYDDFISIVKSSDLVLQGIFSHFAIIDEIKDHPFTHQQEMRFHEALDYFCKAEIKPEMIHMSNSAYVFEKEDSFHTHVRVGASLIGLKPNYYEPFPESLNRCFSWHSQIVSCKRLSKDHNVGYGMTYQTQNEEWIGVIPVGYADGYRRSERNEVLVQGKPVPVVGRICSDFIMVRLPGPVAEGTLVTLIGKQGNETIWVDDLLQRWGTSQAETISTLSNRVPRIYRNMDDRKGV